jgi:hypothetical protein
VTGDGEAAARARRAMAIHATLQLQAATTAAATQLTQFVCSRDVAAASEAAAATAGASGEPQASAVLVVHLQLRQGGSGQLRFEPALEEVPQRLQALLVAVVEVARALPAPAHTLSLSLEALEAGTQAVPVALPYHALLPSVVGGDQDPTGEAFARVSDTLERCVAGCQALAARYQQHSSSLMRVEPAAVVAAAAAAAAAAAVCGLSELEPFAERVEMFRGVQRAVRATSADEVHVGAIAVRCERAKAALVAHAQRVVTALLTRVAADTIQVRALTPSHPTEREREREGQGGAGGARAEGRHGASHPRRSRHHSGGRGDQRAVRGDEHARGQGGRHGGGGDGPARVHSRRAERDGASREGDSASAPPRRHAGRCTIRTTGLGGVHAVDRLPLARQTPPDAAGGRREEQRAAQGARAQLEGAQGGVGEAAGGARGEAGSAGRRPGDGGGAEPGGAGLAHGAKALARGAARRNGGGGGECALVPRSEIAT